MIDRTDRHCRYFYRLLSPHSTLYTEMLTADALIYGPRARLLAFDPSEHPVVVQLAGCDVAKLHDAAAYAAAAGYSALNLNVGCPSPRVQAGRFGACLMSEPQLVAQLVQAMQRAAPQHPISVKCRIGIDDDDPAVTLPRFLAHMVDAGCNQVIIHARKALLQGLSPAQNRSVPPLDYALVYRMKEQFSNLNIVINGGITTIEQAQQHLQHVDGVMVGRAITDNPLLLCQADAVLYNNAQPPLNPQQLTQKLVDYLTQYPEVPFYALAKHTLNLWRGVAGSAARRRILSERGTRADVTPQLLFEALAAVQFSV